MRVKKILWILLGLSLILHPAAAALGQTPPKPATGTAKEKPLPALTGIKVEFKVEAITKESFYMGEVWASPPKFIGIQAGRQVTVNARAWGLDGGPEFRKIEPAWNVSPAGLMTVSPNQGQRVKLTVLQAGQGELLVTYGGLSKRLKVKAEYHDEALQVEISQ
jgi:hypothetical protein